MENKALVNINVEIDQTGLKRLIEEGKLVAFVDTLPAMIAGNVKAQVVEQLVASSGSGAKVSITYDDDDFPSGPGPRPWAEVGIPALTMLSIRTK